MCKNQVSLLIIIASLPGTIIIGKLCLVLLPIAYGLLIALVVRLVLNDTDLVCLVRSW